MKMEMELCQDYDRGPLGTLSKYVEKHCSELITVRLHPKKSYLP